MGVGVLLMGVLASWEEDLRIKRWKGRRVGCCQLRRSSSTLHTHGPSLNNASHFRSDLSSPEENSRVPQNSVKVSPSVALGL